MDEKDEVERCRSPRGAPSAALTAAAILLASTPALALYGGYEQDFRTFSMGKEYFLDELSFQPLPSMLEEWYEAELQPGGARGWRLAYGSLNAFDLMAAQELKLAYPFAHPWSWSFRYEQGDRPSGRYERAWAGVKAGLDSGWSLGVAVTPVGDKEFVDLGLSAGREALSGDRVRLRWEARVVFPDLWYNPKNDEYASFEWQPVDLQLSALASWGPADAASWISIELDRDLPFRKTYGENEDLLPGDPDQDYVFSFENFEATMRGSFKLNARDKLLARLVVLSADRSRDYLDPPDADPGTPDADLDWDDDYDLWLAALEWWRRLDARNELAFGYEYVDFDECTRRPNDPLEPGSAHDRTDHIIFARHRRKLNDGLYLTSGLWVDFTEHARFDFAAGGGTSNSTEAKLSLSLELPRTSPGLGSTRFVLGAFVELDSPGGGGFAQFTAIF